MAGIYIHIPFCKQACHYCNFHFVTSLRQKDELVSALVKEIQLRSDYLENEKVETIYFGGGTPSLLTITELSLLLDTIRQSFNVDMEAEITIETNPDDITEEILAGWKEAGINRLSIGVQSFYDEDLQWMNRAHSSSQAVSSLQLAVRYFNNITADLIYGSPQLTNEKWEKNVQSLLAMNIPHLSCYALTVEPKTPLAKMIKEHRSENINPDKQSEQFLLLMQWMEEAGYEHYEISNFAKPGWRSRHNSSYWSGKKYIGIGPSAHSFNGDERQWNIANNNHYIDAINKGEVPFEKEVLTPMNKRNEYIMTSLRTLEGLNLDQINEEDRSMLLSTARRFLESGLLRKENNSLILTREGKLLADGIASSLFF